MPAINITDLNNAQLDVTHIAAIATSTAATATDRLGNVKKTISGLSAQLLNAGIFANTAAGLTATTNGQYFSAIAAESDSYLVLYLNNAGVAVEQKRYPTKAAVDINTNNIKAGNDAMFTGTLSVDSVAGTATLSGNMFKLSRYENINLSPISNPTLAVTMTTDDFYVFWVDTITKTLGYDIWSNYVDSATKLILCRIHKDVGVLRPTSNICEKLILNGKSVDPAEGISANAQTISNDLALYNGLITFDNTAKLITVGGGGLLNRSGAYATLTANTISYAGAVNAEMLLCINPIDQSLSLRPYQTDVTALKLYGLARVSIDANSQVIKVHYCISDFLLNGQKYIRYFNETARAAADLLAVSSKANSDLALYNGLITFDVIAKTVTVAGGGILNRSGSYVSLSGATIATSSVGANNDYVLCVSTTDSTLILKPYQENILSSSFYVLARVTIVSGAVTAVPYCISDFVLGGITYKKYTASNTVVPARVTSKVYVEIGDSISWQFDGKKENFRSVYPTDTGYIQPGLGYGQKICNYFGITYANHRSHGLNGRTISDYISEVLTTASTDLVFKVPQDGDIYTILLGTNDWGKAQPLGTTADYLNNTLDVNNAATKSIYGGLRKLIDYIASTAVSPKDKKIVFITPLGFGAYAGYGTITSTWQISATGEITERLNSAGYKMSDVVTAIKWAADQVGAQVIDLYGFKGIVQKQRLNIALTTNAGVAAVYQGILGDNLHPTGDGQRALGNLLSAELSKIIALDSF